VADAGASGSIRPLTALRYISGQLVPGFTSPATHLALAAAHFHRLCLLAHRTCLSGVANDVARLARRRWPCFRGLPATSDEELLTPLTRPTIGFAIRKRAACAYASPPHPLSRFTSETELDLTLDLHFDLSPEDADVPGLICRPWTTPHTQSFHGESLACIALGSPWSR
jgi:hypothetical protein